MRHRVWHPGRENPSSQDPIPCGRPVPHHLHKERFLVRYSEIDSGLSSIQPRRPPSDRSSIHPTRDATPRRDATSLYTLAYNEDCEMRHCFTSPCFTHAICIKSNALRLRGKRKVIDDMTKDVQLYLVFIREPVFCKNICGLSSP